MAAIRLAKLSIWKSVALLVLGLGSIVPLYYFPILEGPIAFLKGELLWAPFIVIAWICGLYVAPIFFYLAFQLFFRRCAGLWVENGRIVYLNNRFLSIPIAEIRSMQFDSFKAYGLNIPSIKVSLTSGSIKSIPTGFLSDSAESVKVKIENLAKLENQKTSLA